MRALGDRSYLLVADEYINLNSRLAYHFTLVDACLSQSRQPQLHFLPLRRRRRHSVPPQSQGLLSSRPAWRTMDSWWTAAATW